MFLEVAKHQEAVAYVDFLLNQEGGWACKDDAYQTVWAEERCSDHVRLDGTYDCSCFCLQIYNHRDENNRPW